jgi:hypothetical protein
MSLLAIAGVKTYQASASLVRQSPFENFMFSELLQSQFHSFSEHI